MPRMLFDRSEIHEVKQRTDRGINSVVELSSFLIRQSRGLDKLRRAVEVLLKKHRRLDAARISLQYRRTVLQERHDVVRDFQVITEQIKLREFFVGPVNTVQARYRNLLAAHLQHEVAFRTVQLQKLINCDNSATFLTGSFYFRHFDLVFWHTRLF